MGPRRTLIVLIAAAIAGCGGDSGDSENTDSAVRQDAEAKSEARYAVTEMESCFVERQSYTDCSPTQASDDVSLMTAVDSFTISVPSGSGNSFEVSRRPSGELERSCEQPGEGGCPGSGEW